MIVYHGGIDVIEKPDINHSYRPLDQWDRERALKK